MFLFQVINRYRRRLSADEGIASSIAIGINRRYNLRACIVTESIELVVNPLVPIIYTLSKGLNKGGLGP
jgi:hypothetical protein